MTYEETFKVMTAILTSLGGGTILLFGLSNWLGHVWADKIAKAYLLDYEKKLSHFRNDLIKDIEKSKDRIGKSNLIFDDYIKATKDIVRLYREHRPTMTHPDKDFSDACQDIGRSCSAINKAFMEFEIAYGHILSIEEMRIVGEIISDSDALSFEEDEDHQISSSGEKMAGDVLKNMESLRSSIRDKLLAMTTA